jgi:membrane protein
MTATHASSAGDVRRGRQAESPTEIPARGWKDVLVRTQKEMKRDNVPLLAAGVAFYALLALVPALVAAVSLYGLIADPSEIERQVREFLGAAPTEARELIQAQLQDIVEDRQSSIGLGLLFGLIVALWSASSGVKQLIGAINVAYDEEETRKFFKLRGLALLLSISAIVFLLLAVTIIAVVPNVIEDIGLGAAGKTVVTILRWPALAAGFVVGLSILYRVGPNRDDAEWRWVSWGAIVATGLWLIASGLFSIYAANFASYNETYGSLGAVVVVMLWLLLTAYAIIVGAELNAELERQTVRDSTRGRDRPLGQRDATVADTVGPTAEEIRAGG